MKEGIKLTKIQEIALERARGKEGFGFFLPTGQGKTLVSLLAGINEGIKNFLVIGPVSSKEAWEREARKLGLGFYDLREGKGERKEKTVYWINYENTFKTVETRRKKDVILNPEVVKLVKEIGKEGAIILDESHYIKNYYATRTKISLALRRHFKRAYILTATPSEKYEELFPQFLFLVPGVIKEKYPSYNAFRSKHLIEEVKKHPNGARYKKVVGYKNIEEFLKLIEPYYISAFKKVKQEKKIWIAIRNPKETLGELIEKYENFTHAHMAASGYCPRERKWIHEDKVDRVLEIVSKEGTVVIFCNFIHEAKKLGEVLGCPVITGETPKDLSVWREGPLVATYALSESVDLTKAGAMIFFSYPLAWKKFYQALGRINRITQERDVVYYYLLYTEAEKPIIKLIWKKKDVNASVISKMFKKPKSLSNPRKKTPQGILF